MNTENADPMKLAAEYLMLLRISTPNGRLVHEQAQVIMVLQDAVDSAEVPRHEWFDRARALLQAERKLILVGFGNRPYSLRRFEY